jgi:hypothetical protein
VSCVVIVLSCMRCCVPPPPMMGGRPRALLKCVVASSSQQWFRPLASQRWSAQSYWNRIPLHSKGTGRLMRARTAGRYKALFYPVRLLAGFFRLVVTTCSTILSLAWTAVASLPRTNSWLGGVQLDSIYLFVQNLTTLSH